MKREDFKKAILNSLSSSRTTISVYTCTMSYPLLSSTTIRKGLNELVKEGKLTKLRHTAGIGMCPYGTAEPRWEYFYFLAT